MLRGVVTATDVVVDAIASDAGLAGTSGTSVVDAAVSDTVGSGVLGDEASGGEPLAGRSPDEHATATMHTATTVRRPAPGTRS